MSNAFTAEFKRDAVVHANRIRSYLMAAFNYGLKADNDPMNTSVG
ncbi:hypothetical protein GCM10011513_21510 [Franconibacter daqui]|nr:hypothetical protein [Franconibacter daqui]GGD23697.1 hypothetical protein GCM10011513_21510 [Franconibacter daqui]